MRRRLAVFITAAASLGLSVADERQALSESLLALALIEKQNRDPYLYWLFATAAAEASPGTRQAVAHAVQAASAIVPALTTQLLDAASTAHGGQQDDALRTDPSWLSALRRDVQAHMAKVSLKPVHCAHADAGVLTANRIRLLRRVVCIVSSASTRTASSACP